MEDKANNQPKQYVVFKLGKEDYGLDIHKVTTIEKILPITRVPKSPNFIAGVINLRGEIVPIMDLSKRFNLAAVQETDEARIVIMKVGEDSLGIIVDEVDDVLALNQEDIENVANYSSELSMNYVLGVGKVDDRIITLLNISKLSEINDSD